MTGIISDIHGNHEALSAVLEELDRMGVDRVICLGDVGGYYCQVNECCETLRKRGIFTLMGNHDWYLATGGSCPRSGSANRCLDYQRKVIRGDNLKWMASLSPRALIDGLSVVHGGWSDPLDEYVVPSNGYFAGMTGRQFASGHTHVPCIWTGGEKAYCNPGSVGQPRDGDPRASFAAWDGRDFRLFRVAYDVESLQMEMRKSGFAPYYYENLSAGTRIGGKVDRLERQPDRDRGHDG